MMDPIARKLATAPLEDELIPAEEALAAAEARQWLKEHETIPNDVVLADVGITPEEFERMGCTPIVPAQDER